MTTPTFKNILVGLVGEPPLPSAALDFALDLANSCRAHVTVEVDSVEATPIGAMNYEAAFAVAAVNDRFESGNERTANQVRDLASTLGVSCRVLTWTANTIALKRNFAALGRIHDLAILDAARGLESPTQDYIQAALFETGRPVMIIPAPTIRRVFKRSVIAWDGSVEAARAVNDAMSVLSCMDTVEILALRTGDDDRLDGLALHLLRHGITAKKTHRPIVGNDVGKTLVAYLQDAGEIDLVIMGGYSHSRAREWILGGTTRTMLETCETPLFMSH